MRATVDLRVVGLRLATGEVAGVAGAAGAEVAGTVAAGAVATGEVSVVVAGTVSVAASVAVAVARAITDDTAIAASITSGINAATGAGHHGNSVMVRSRRATKLITKAPPAIATAPVAPARYAHRLRPRPTLNVRPSVIATSASGGTAARAAAAQGCGPPASRTWPVFPATETATAAARRHFQ